MTADHSREGDAGGRFERPPPMGEEGSRLSVPGPATLPHGGPWSVLAAEGQRRPGVVSQYYYLTRVHILKASNGSHHRDTAVGSLADI